jgi:3-oxoacyl-[acyl-carrier protein] reductase
MATTLGALGADVVVNHLSNADAAGQVVDAIQAVGTKAVAVQADVGRPDDAMQLLRATVVRCGKVDILVNNAGLFLGGPVDEISETDFDCIFAANVESVLFASQGARAFANGGNIVNLSSINTRAPSPRGALYSATKAAIGSLTASLAREWGSRGIRVNSCARTDGKRHAPICQSTRESSSESQSLCARSSRLAARNCGGRGFPRF